MSRLPQPEPALIDAFDGSHEVGGTVTPAYAGWSVTRPAMPEGTALVPTEPKYKNPADPEVGWGLVLPESPGASGAEQATAADAPPEIQRLLAHRKGKVLRYRAGDLSSNSNLIDPLATDIPIVSGSLGVAPGRLPKYLLIYGSPDTIPWQLQFNLNTTRCVGRLDLTGDALARYVDAAIADWPGSKADYGAPVVWSVDTGGGVERDMTTLMRRTVALPLQKAFAEDQDMQRLTYLDGSRQPALVATLTEALAARSPALVVTTSHGLTAPVDDPAALRARLGTPVDQLYQPLDPAALLAGWQPDGAVWFAQACCSAGGNGPSVYQGLFPLTGEVGSVLFGVAALGAAVAPLPRALLGAEKPLRAFIGRVEPTFNWTLRDQVTGVPLTSDLVTSVYRRLCLGYPVGYAMEPFFSPISGLLVDYLGLRAIYEQNSGAVAAAAAERALYRKVASFDRAALVILGDPAVVIPTPV